MKCRRNFVVAILLVAIMCIGVGFAAISSKLGLKGTVTYKPAFSIEWKADSVELDDAVLDSTISDVDDTSTLQFTIDTTSWNVNEPHEIKAVIANNSKYDAKNITVSSVTYGDNKGYYEVTVARIADISAGAEGTVTITINMKKYPQTDASYTGTFSFTVTADQAIA